MSLGARWRTYRALEARERRLFWHALALVPAMHVLVRVVGFNRLQRRVGARAPVASRSPLTPLDARRLCTLAVSRVKYHSPLRGNCLSQSLALVWLLRREGLTPTLRLGVRLQDAKFDAHAWVEDEGRVLNDTPDVHTRFAPLTGRTGTP